MITRRTASLLLPLLVILLIAITYPWFSRGFDAGVSALRLRLGQIGTQMGVVPERSGTMLGIYSPESPYSLARIRDVEQAIGRPFDIISFYQTWGDREEDRFPRQLMRTVAQHEGMAMITWEPWLSEFQRNRGEPGYGSRTDLREVVGGTYDAYIREWAREASIFGRVFLLRFAHEMNNPQYPWSTEAGNRPEDFVAAWRHVWSIFREEGARNVVWVWSPWGAPPQSLYPGGEYVDWVGVSVFNYGVYAEGGGWQSFEYVYDPIYRAALRFERPIMIAELGSVSLGGNQAQWYGAAMERITTRYPRTGAIVLFNNPVDRTFPGAVIDWSIDSNPDVLDVFRRHAADGALARPAPRR
jgi:hypothetical protein